MRRHILAAFTAVAMLAVPWTPLEAQQEWTFDGRELLVTNLVGQVTVRGHDGPQIVVRATPFGKDAGLVSFEVEPGGRAEFHAIFPLERSRRYVHPRLGDGRTTFSVESWRGESSVLGEILAAVGGKDRIEVPGRPSKGALEAWADLEVLVPEGVPTHVRLGVGRLEASDVAAAIDLDSNAGAVQVANIRGATRVDTGSGAVVVRSVRGALDVDTGSGSVEVHDVEGDAIRVDTGSGSVTVERALARTFEVDTGSGSVDTRGIDAGESVIDTGSGSVTLALVRLDGGSHSIDTGSGGVTLLLPSDASARIRAETGSGGIRLDVPAAKLHRMNRSEMDVELGEGAAQVTIDTGSGGVTISSER